MGDDARARFITAAVWHGGLDLAQAVLSEHPELAQSDVHTAALLGDAPLVREFIARDRASATAKSEPLQWDALTHLCFSNFLRLDRSRSAGFVEAARALLDAGASANTGFFDTTHLPSPEWESALYGAAGVAHHAELTRLLLEHGADPNDEEVPYHSPETYDNAALEALLECGLLTEGSLATILLRKADWHDHDGLKLVLKYGADPNSLTRWHYTALHQALRRDNALANINLLLDADADPRLPNRMDGLSSIEIAAWRGRGDVLELLETRGVTDTFEGIERLVAACARGDRDRVRAIAVDEPHLIAQLMPRGGAVLSTFAGNGNDRGVECLLSLGIAVDARFAEGDGYYDVAPGSTALHAAAWRLRPTVVKLLIARGADVSALDGKGRSPLMLAVRACVDSYWSDRRTPDSVEALLNAGASTSGVAFPSGYDAVDALLRNARMRD
jgi:ankyrin repeat protein